MNSTEKVEKELDSIREEEDALDQSVALNRIVLELLKTKAQETKRLWIALILSIFINLFIVAGFLWYESQWEYTTETVTEVSQESDEDGMNLLQIGDDSRMFLGVGEEVEDGQAISENNSNQDSQP